MTTTHTRFQGGLPEFGDRVGHRDPGSWGRYVPGRVVAVDVHQGRPRVRVHPTYRHSPEWEAHPDDLVRVGRNPLPARYGPGRAAVTGASQDRVAAERTAHHVGGEPRPHRPGRPRFTADGVRWAEPEHDLRNGSPRR